jgi:F-type H+-transporting ATPase subunit b
MMKSHLIVALLVGAVLGTGASWAHAQDSKEPAAEAGAEHAGGHGHELGHGNAGAGLESMTEVRTDLAIYTFLVFLALLALLGSLAWPKISVALLEREKRIEGAIADAQANLEQSKKVLAEHEAKLAGAAAEVRSLLEDARKDAEATKAQIVAEARDAAKAEHQRAQRDIDNAVDGATKHLAEMAANLAVELAGKAIRETINPAKSQELVREALSKLSSVAPSKN